MRIVFARNLLFWWQERFDCAEINVNHVGTRTLLNNTGNDVAFFALELTEQTFVADLAQTLCDDLLCRISGDAAEVFWRDIFL